MAKKKEVEAVVLPTLFKIIPAMIPKQCSVVDTNDNVIIADWLSLKAASLVTNALNSFVLIADGNTSPQWIAEMFLRDIELLKP